MLTHVSALNMVRVGTAALVLCATAIHAAPVVANTNNITTLTNALVQSGGGINIVTSNLVSGQVSQQGTYAGFNLAPSSGSTPTLTIGNGVVLSSGRADVAASNTANETTVNTGNGGYAALTTLAQTLTPGISTNNANVLEYSFTLDSGLNAITLDFLFGTEEFPTQNVTDIFGVFVDGVNYAKFSNGDLVANNPGNPTNFINNPVGGGLYAIEYNGLSRQLSLNGLVNTGLSTHTLIIGIADTQDTRYDSGVYLANLRGVNTDSGGINPPTVPEPGTLALVGISLVGFAFARRKA